MKATIDKNNAVAQAEKTLRKAGLADRLINGLSGENARWGTEIKRMEAVEGKLVRLPIRSQTITLTSRLSP